MGLYPMLTYPFDGQVTGIEVDRRSYVFCGERPPRWRMGGYGARLGPGEMSTLLLIGRFDGTVLRFAILVRPRNTILAVLAMESSQLDNVSTELKGNRFRLRCTMRCPPGLLFQDFDQTHYALALGTPARLDVDLSATLDDRAFRRTYARILPAFAANRSPEVQRVLADLQEAIRVKESSGKPDRAKQPKKADAGKTSVGTATRPAIQCGQRLGEPAISS